jgi:energy-coupling factor transporter ATP-binding protein EcfA2
MRIKSIHIKNYKSLRDVKLEGLENLVVLIGRNSSGKTNLLELLNRFFAEIDITGSTPGIDQYSWFDGNMEIPIEITLTLVLDEEECNRIFPPEILKLVKEKFPEKSNELTICREIIKPPTGWRDKSIKWAEIPLIDDGKLISLQQFATALSLKYISFDDIQVVFFTPGASPANMLGDRLVLLKPIKKAYFMSPYAEELVRSGKVKWFNVSDKTTDWRKYIADEGYELINQGLSEEHLRPEAAWLRPEYITNIISAIRREMKSLFRLLPAARDALPQSLLQRYTLLDQPTHDFLRSIAMSEIRTDQKKWSKIEKIFNEAIPGARISALQNYLRVTEEDLPLPIHYRGGGEQELLLILRFLIEEKTILGVEEPELHAHPGLARKLLEIFKTFAKDGKQIFITTHSPIFVDYTDISITWIVKKEGKETRVLRVEKSKELQDLIYELGIRPSDIFFSNAIIFVEGETDRRVFPIWAKKIGIPIEPPEVSIFPTHGKERGRYMLDVWLDASSVANIPYFMILDKDAEKEAKKYVNEGKLEPNKNLFILKKGSIEDYYPSKKLIEAIESVCGIKLDEEERKRIVEIPRSKKIEELLKSKGFSKGKKVDIGIKVAESMSVDEIDDEIRGILERIYSSLKIGR